MEQDKLELTCPCCEATIVADRITGEILWHKEKVKSAKGSFEEMVSQLESQKAEASKKFEKNLESQKDRARLLEEKFKEALKRADKSDKPMHNPLDLD
jgi:hypothetical protein